MPSNFFSKSWRRVLTGNWARLGSIRYFILRDTFENDLIPALPPSGHGEAFCSARYQPEIICVHGVAKILLRYERFQAVHHTNIYTALYTCDRRLPARLRSLEGIGSERDPWITGMRRISPPPLPFKPRRKDLSFEHLRSSRRSISPWERSSQRVAHSYSSIPDYFSLSLSNFSEKKRNSSLVRRVISRDLRRQSLVTRP